MKKGLLYLGMIAVTMGMFTTKVMAQDVLTAGDAVTYTMPEMKLLAVAGTAPALTFVAPANGAAIADVTSSGSWLNYTSIVSGILKNRIQVKITGTVPAGTTLKVVAAAPAATGDGAKGTSGSEVTLDATDKNLITLIGSCYTGTGASSGAQLTYTWSVNSDGYADLRSNAEASNISTVYTILAGQ